MDEPVRRPEFDEQARDRIRRGLRRYMEAHRIGTPTLLTRIMEADAPRFRELPLSTLQRFLADSHRTLDPYVDMCGQFLKSQEKSPAREFGEAFLSFAGREPDLETADGLSLSGRLDSLAAAWESYAGDSNTPYSEIAFTKEAGRSFLFAEEAVFFNLPERPGRRERRPFEGAAVLSGSRLVAVLRDGLTRAPKCYSLSWGNLPLSGGPLLTLDGELFLAADAPSGGSYLHIQFRRPSLVGAPS
jgi:hypothetical protein